MLKGKNKSRIISSEKLYFIIFVIHAIAKKYNISQKTVYKVLNRTDIIDNYIVRCYDVVHSMGEKAIVNDVEKYLKNRGIKIC